MEKRRLTTNRNAIFSSYTNDTRKPAAYIVKAALDTEKLVAGSSVWCFSDIFEEFSEIPEEFHGGFGLLTHSGIPKPAYYAMKMLVELCDNRIVLDKDVSDGEVGIAAFEDVDKKNVLRLRLHLSGLPKRYFWNALMRNIVIRFSYGKQWAVPRN